MAERICIYGPAHDRGYDTELQRLKEWRTSRRNKELMQKWHNHLFATGTGQLRVVKLSTQLRKIVLHLDNDLDCALKEDIERVIAAYNQEESWSAATKADYRRCIKQFYRWFEEEDHRLRQGDEDARRLYKYLNRHVSVSYKLPSYDYSEVVSEEDLDLVLEKGCTNIKEKAFIAVLHEGGFRAAEMLNIQLRDLHFKDDRVVVKVDGKTGERRVPLVRSMGYLGRWLDDHPFKGNPHSHLWIGDNRIPRLRHKPIKHGGAQKLINRVFSRAELKKKHNLHWFRHSRATLNAPHMSEVILCRFFGWTIGSKQVRRYVHSNVGQVEDAVLAMNGIRKQEQEESGVRKCACGMVNERQARYCHKCGKPMSAGVMMQDETSRDAAIEEAMEMLQRIMEDPVLRERFAQFRG